MPSLQEMGLGVVQCSLSSNAKQSVDFYIEEEATVIEVEFSLSNPYPCLENDAFKVLLAKDEGCSIETLILVGDPGSKKRPGCKKRLSARPHEPFRSGYSAITTFRFGLLSSTMHPRSKVQIAYCSK